MKANLDRAAITRHNLRNAAHTAILVAGTGLLAAAIAWTVYGPDGLMWAAIFGAAGIWVLGRVSPAMILSLYKARPLAPHEAPELQRLAADLAARAGLPAPPKLHYVHSNMLNAFAVGRPADSAIAVTDGLLRTMTVRQLAGILAHEISHIRNGDLRVMGLADVLNRITGFMSTMGLIGLPFMLAAGWRIPIPGFVLLIFAPTLGGLLQLALSRAREYDADLDGATLTADPEGLASALATLEKRQGAAWEGLFLPGSRLPQPSLLRSHPRTEDRIARLMGLRAGASGTMLPNIRVAPGPSIVPPVGDPRIRWLRLGIWY